MYRYAGSVQAQLTLQCVLVASSKLFTTERITQEKKPNRAKSNGSRRIFCSFISNNRIVSTFMLNKQEIESNSTESLKLLYEPAIAV